MTSGHAIKPSKKWEPVMCDVCGREVLRVFDKSKPVGHRVYWRHRRQR